MNRRRGYLLMELMGVLLLTAITLTMATVLLGRTWQVHRAAAASAQRAAVFEQCVITLRRDVAQAESLNVTADALDLGPAVRWVPQGKRLLRRDVAGERTFDLEAAATFAAVHGGAKLRLAESDRPATAIGFVSPVAWAAEVSQ